LECWPGRWVFGCDADSACLTQAGADSRHLCRLAAGLCGDESSHPSYSTQAGGENFHWAQAREVFERMEEASHFGKLVLTVE